MFKASLEDVGGIVSVAGTYAEAVNVVRKICRSVGARSVIVSQSPLIDRLSLESALANEGAIVKFTSELTDGNALSIIAQSDLGITDALAAVAETGSVAVVTKSELDRLVSALPPVHVVLLEKGRLIDSLNEVGNLVSQPLTKNEPYTLSLITGPSRTADIEEVLVRGVHGPHLFHVIVIEESTAD